VLADRLDRGGRAEGGFYNGKKTSHWRLSRH